MLKLHRLASPALAALLAAVGPLAAEEPRPLPNANQQTASAVANELRASGQFKNYRIDVACQDGRVELTGSVNEARQCDEAARIAARVPGVTNVTNRVNVANGTVRVADFAPEQAPPPRRMADAPAEPVPSFRAPISGAAQSAPPPLPNYAWPTYAPHNNYSRVAYPQAYPYNAFPFIGPIHPFPKAPMGWGKVVLQFDDGHWWLSSHAKGHDWWMLRYW